VSVVTTTRVSIRRHRRLRGLFVVTEHFAGGTVALVRWESTSLREALQRVMDSKEPGYVLDIKLTV
jgi:hypothetical protein